MTTTHGSGYTTHRLEPAMEQPKKRQRMSMVCVNCKARKIKCDKRRPACTNCVKCSVGHLCHYEPPHWVTQTAEPAQPLAAAVAVAQTPAETTVLPVPSVTIGSAHQEMERLRAQLQALEQAITAPKPENTDAIDFYELYNSLVVKRSAMEEHKPLSAIAHYRKDQFSMVIAGYFNLCSALYKARFGDLKKPKETKKTRLDASVTEFLYLLGERESPEVVEVVSRFIQERMAKTSPKSNGFAFGTEDNESSTITKAQALLPNLRIIRLYLTHFYKYVYPYFPFVSRSSFDDKVFSILQSNDEESPVTIVIDEKFDLLIVSILLIVLRLTYISLPVQSKSQILKQNPITPENISSAVGILSLFKVTRKTKLTVIQALLYYRLYLVYAPEDGDGSELTHSQPLTGLIVQSAYTIGLNRDSSNHVQLNFDKDHANLWRRIWLGILESDRVISTLAGHICAVQNVNSYDTRIPEIDLSGSPMDRAIAEEFKRSQKLLLMYHELGNMVNNLVKAPRVCELLDLLRQMEVYCQISYPLDNMQKISQAKPDEVDVVNFINVKKLLHNFQVRAFKLTVYQSLSLHYESLQHQDFVKAKEFLVISLKTSVEVSNMSYRFLTHQYMDYVDSNHKFYLVRYLDNVSQRAMNSFVSFLIRLHHGVDLLSRGIGSRELSRILKQAINITYKATSGLIVLTQNCLGTRYYQVFKASLKYKFYVRSLHKEGYKCVRDTIDFINAKFLDDPMARINLLQRIDLKMSPSTALQELDTMNFLVTSSVEFLEGLKSIISEFEVLQDPVFSSDGLIWEPSFKSLPLSELRGFEPVDDATLLRGLGVDELLHRGESFTAAVINLDQLLALDGPLNFDDLMRTSDENGEWLSRL